MSTVAEIGVPGLAGLQRAFQAFLLGRGGSLEALIADGPNADHLKRIDIYREGYALRLVEALEADFPGLVAIAGRQTFAVLARAYVAAHPSRHASLRWFGRHLGAFLASDPPWSASPALAEMAHFEWALGEAWDAPDGPPVPASALMALPVDAWETLSFAATSSLLTLTLSFGVPRAWQRREQAGPHDVEASSCGPVAWVVWRDDAKIQFRTLEVDEADLLQGLIAGESFPQLCRRLTALDDEAAAVARAAGLLRGWVEAGLIGSFTYRSAER
jgi:hypothetical protein